MRKVIDEQLSPTKLAPQDSHGFNTRRAHRAFDRLLNAYLQREGLATGFWYYLRLLWIDDGQTQKALSRRNNVAENTTTALIVAMEKAGLVTRERDAADRRRSIVRLTDKGRALRPKLIPFADHVNEIARQGISQTDLAICLDVLKKMSANLEEAFVAISEDEASQ